MNRSESYLCSPWPKNIPRFTPKLKIGVLASGEGTNFESLYHACQNSIIDAEIPLLIVNNSHAGAIRRASRLGVPFNLVDHRNYKTKLEFETDIITMFKAENIEIIVMAGWMRIASSTLINAYNNRIINIHPSLLPSFKGVDAIDQALKAGVKVTGCTIHYVRNEVDAGPIILQSAVSISRDDDKKSLRNKIHKLEHLSLPLALAIVGNELRESFFHG